jgi:hypothetical protein
VEPADANGAAIATIAGLPADSAPVVIEAYGATSLHRQRELPKSSRWTELTQARDAYRDVHELYAG